MDAASIFSLLKDPVLFGLAIYGAGLSTYNLFKSIQKDKRRVVVKMSTAKVAYGPKLGPANAAIEVTNLGHRPVTIKQIFFRLPDGRTIITLNDVIPGLDDTKMPIKLEDGATARKYYSYQSIGQGLIHARMKKIKLYPACEDSTGQVHVGKFWNVDVDKIANM